MARKLAQGQGLLGEEYRHRAKDILSARFLIPPFSVLNTREGQWQERKRQWIALGIKSELGRGGTASTYTPKFEGESVADSLALARGYRKTGAVVPTGGGMLAALPAQRGYKNSGLGAVYKGSKGDVAENIRNGQPIRRGAQAVTYNTGASGDLRKSLIRPRVIDSSPGGSARPAMNYKNRERGDGAGRPLAALPNFAERTDGFAEAARDRAPQGAEGGTSIFDPVLCELAYRWFCPPGGTVLDPFAGGSVRGIVAGEMGLQYFGIDLSARQLDANREQAKAIGTTPTPVWAEGDAMDVLKLADDHDGGENYPLDFIFSCPPYGDLERYSDDPRDLSVMDANQFLEKYYAIISRSTALLESGAFACFVVGDYRDKDGFYCNLPGETIAAFEDAGMRLYNHAILVTATGSLPLRIDKQFKGSRKLGNTHQHVLVFAKGNPKQFVKTWPPLYVE